MIVRDSAFVDNGAGVVPNTLGTQELGPNRGTMILANVVRRNNYKTIPEPASSEPLAIPFGTGIWLAGTENNVVRNNRVEHHERYGILVTASADTESAPMNNRILYNLISGSGVFDLAFDGGGENNCFSGNVHATSGPSEIQTLYDCADRPFTNSSYAPVAEDVAAAIAASETREQKEPPDPSRPRCQRGKPGCNR